jgi:hypothetical protein
MKSSDLKSPESNSFPSQHLSDDLATPHLPWFSIFALISIPLLTVCSLPFWRENIEQQISSSAASSNVSDSGRGGGFGLVVGGFLTAIVASYVGLILALLAQKKKERWLVIRVAAWVINGIAASTGTFILFKYFVRFT